MSAVPNLTLNESKTFYLEGLSCAVCGSNEKLEIHHVRSLNKLDKNKLVDSIMAKRRRKQLEVCKKCHINHHMKNKRIDKLNGGYPWRGLNLI